MEEKQKKWYTEAMSIGGIGGIGGGGGDWNRPPSGPPPPGGGGDDNNRKVGGGKKKEEDDPMNPKDELTLSTADEQIAYYQGLNSDQLLRVSEETLNALARDPNIMANAAHMAAVSDLIRRQTIYRGATGAHAAYLKTMSMYPLPVQPVEPIAPVNPDPLPQTNIEEEADEKEKDDEKSDQS